MAQDLESRLDRQNRYPGWNQDVLDNAAITLIGSGPLCHFVATALTGLQVGSVKIVDNSRFNGTPQNEFLYLDNPIPAAESKVYVLKDILSTMNGKMDIDGIHSTFVGQLVKDSNVLVDLTNNPGSKSRSFRFAVKQKILYISASVDRTKGTMISYDPNNPKQNQPAEGDFMHVEFKGQAQGAIPSGVIAGAVVDDIRRMLFKLSPGESAATNRIYYNLLSDARFKPTDDHEKADGSYYKDRKIAVIGAGALGNFVGINLALLGVGNVTFIDYDIISNSNLNRQPLFSFYDSVDRKKVDVITDILRKINPKVKFEGIDGKIVNSNEELSDEDKKKGVKPVDLSYLFEFDAIISCGDNPDVRLTLNDYVSRLRQTQNKVIPLLDGGTSPKNGNAAVYIPGINACIDSQLGYSAMPRIKQRCAADDHAPSVVYTNLTIGSLLCGELSLVLAPGMPQMPIKNPLFYTGISASRFGLQVIESQRCELCR